ncbi:hypothetical protein CENSYa_1746 [Cenarchaeum symbiosum A]|uniref:PIN domain-containing protein n=1 Tax=Cenarchaeum symbiosum (strain A) TaxID=414004 RepID=A0RYE0_CENSY|nr:hypothetical protein CENSYa_1746 [Cenarchaeum symbiosum A]
MLDNKTGENAPTHGSEEDLSDRVYFDTMIYLGEYVEKNDDFTRIFNMVREKKFQLVVSTINLLEIRRYITHKYQFRGLKNAKTTCLFQNVNDEYNDVVNGIRGDLGIICRQALHDIGELEMEKLAKDIHCLCKEDFYEIGKIAGSADVLQLKAARNMGCIKFITIDTALLKLRSHNGFLGMRIMTPRDLSAGWRAP